MPSISQTVADLQSRGPIVDVILRPSSAFLRLIKGDEEEYAKYGNLSYRARMLVDTGASCSTINHEVKDILKLTSHGFTQVGTPSKAAQVAELYDIDFVFPEHDNFRFNNIRVAQVDISSQGIDGLIGRDILQGCLFVYNGASNSITLSM